MWDGLGGLRSTRRGARGRRRGRRGQHPRRGRASGGSTVSTTSTARSTARRVAGFDTTWTGTAPPPRRTRGAPVAAGKEDRLHGGLAQIGASKSASTWSVPVRSELLLELRLISSSSSRCRALCSPIGWKRPEGAELEAVDEVDGLHPAPRRERPRAEELRAEPCAGQLGGDGVDGRDWSSDVGVA